MFEKYLPPTCALLLLAASAGAQTVSVRSVVSISLTGENPFQLKVHTSGPVSPEIEMVSGPERLVIDLPNAKPASGLHGLSESRGDIRGVRVGLFRSNPPVTRVVVDLTRPHWYRLVHDSSGLVVTLGSDSEVTENVQPMIGWVSTKLPATSAETHASPLVKKAAAVNSLPEVNGVRVQFADGQMTIHANNATLSEVLFQIQKTTGAEIAIPSGTEQDKVSADFGPGTPSQVLAQLLNGSGLNFVVVGSEADPNGLRSVILSRAAAGVDVPPPSVPPDQAVTAETESFAPPPPPETFTPPAPPTPDNPPPPEPQPNSGLPAPPPPDQPTGN